MPASTKKFSETISPVKRELSRFEKSSLPSVNGKALVFPAESGTEIEELVEAGIIPANIVGIDKEAEVANRLRIDYVDFCQIHHASMLEFIQRTRTPHQYCYIHVDPCGCFNDELCDISLNLPTLLASTARVRLTAFDPRRSPSVVANERKWVEQVLIRICEIGYQQSSEPTVWAKRMSTLEVTDTSHAMIAILLLNHFFGNPSTVLARLDHHDLPAAHGEHLISRINRWRYKETSTPNYMTTVWVDLRPFPRNAARTNTEWILNYVGSVLDNCHDIASIYTPGMLERPF